MTGAEAAKADFSVAVMSGITPANGHRYAAELRARLATSAVVCLRFDQALEKDEFEQIAELFGPVKDPVGLAKDGTTYRYSKKRQVIDAGYVLTDEDRQNSSGFNHGFNYGGLDDKRPGLFETWHCDDTYTEDPAQATILHARALPQSGGGPTHFLDMRAAYVQLDSATRQRLEGLKVLYAYNNEGAFGSRVSASGDADVLVEVTHPLVRTHPVAKTKALFIDLDRAKFIVDLPVAEGCSLLQKLQDHAEAKAPTCHHEWQRHDVLVWDNASVQHKAGGNFKLGEARRFWRHMIAGPAPR
jgi:alpha-ketoglutarate-dependent taurine dioxygenase